MKEDSKVTAAYTITMADYKNGCPLEKIRATLKRSAKTSSMNYVKSTSNRRNYKCGKI